jgi:apolipoprotein N-acyltransferase
MAAPFTETWINVDIPLVRGGAPTLYTRYGDWLAFTFTFAGVILLPFGAISAIIKKSKKEGADGRP